MLFPFQQEGAAFLAERPRALLADDPGLGKSGQAVTAAVRVGAKSARVICPASLRENWKREFKKFGGGHIDLQVVSYNQAARWGSQAPCMSYVDQDMEPDVLIIDEAHFLKTVDAVRTEKVYGPNLDLSTGIAANAKYVWLLTGTPAPNHPGELYTHIRALWPQILGKFAANKKVAVSQFIRKYCRTQMTPYGLKPIGVNHKTINDLKAAMGPYVLRRRKDEVLKDLPAKMFDILPVSPELATSEINLDAKQMKLLELALASGADGLKAIGDHLSTFRAHCGLIKAARCVDYAVDYIENNEKIVLFAIHREVIELLYHNLSRKTKVAMITGATPVEQRQAMVDAFQNDPEVKIFIGQIQAAGTGITLTAASHLLFVESSWVPAENVQAADRIHRIGQTKPCLIRFASWAGSIDDTISEALARKTEMLTALFD